MYFQDFLLIGFSVFFILLAASVFAHMMFLVPYVPSKKRVVTRMIRAAKLKEGERVYDLGCGDGRLLLEAEKKVPVKTEGFEIAPLVYGLAWLRKKIAGSSMKLRFQNLFSANLKRADVIFCYLLPHVMPRLRKKILRECRRGTRIVSNTFHIPGLTPTKVLKRNRKKGLPTVYVYIV
ncbi:class I SAM-dependent methyltransferase [Candidatus Peregrinibacteria bacterium]|nr:class I SAM-dependent methyltransferase [Candidatus Peregrinibacteria bacterium]